MRSLPVSVLNGAHEPALNLTPWFCGPPLGRLFSLCLTLLLLAGAGRPSLPAQTPPEVGILHAFTNNGSAPYGSLVRDASGNLYGTTSAGGSQNLGTVFKLAPDGTLTTLVDFNGSNGARPLAGLILASDGNFYGTTSLGGSDFQQFPGGGVVLGVGTVFRMTPAGVLTQLVSFGALPAGAPTSPQAALLQGADGNFYGTSFSGGSAGMGTVFKMTPAGLVSVLASFDGTNGARPVAPLIQTADQLFYGTTQGTDSANGTAFRLTTAGALTTLAVFPPQFIAAGPAAPLVLAGDGSFYGTTFNGGTGNQGRVFRLTPGGTLSVIYHFRATDAEDAENPQGALIVGADGALYGTTRYGSDSPGGAIFRITTGGQYSILAKPPRTTGELFQAGPAGGLLLAPDGNFYGTTTALGANGLGEIFKVTPAGAFSVLASFYYPFGANPTAPLTADPSGNLYGVAANGGIFGAGVAFRLGTDGSLTALANFDPAAATGIRPMNQLARGADGNFYGVTSADGAGNFQAGSLFQLTPTGTLTAIASPPALPYGAGPLALGIDNNLYGLSTDDFHGIGTFFRLNPDHSITTLHTFPQGIIQYYTLSLAQDAAGNFYGVSPRGGAHGSGTAFRLGLDGTFSTILDFNGIKPLGPLTRGIDGQFYGLAISSSNNNSSSGSLYRLTPTGALTTLTSGSFNSPGLSGASLVTGSDGGIYGYELGTGLFRLAANNTLNALATVPLTFEGEGGFVADFTFTAGPAGKIYGTSNAGGRSGGGLLFGYDPSGSGPTPTPTPTPTPIPTPTPTPTPPPGSTPTPTLVPGATPTPTPPPGSTPTPTLVPGATPTPTPTSALPPAPTLYDLNRHAGGDRGPFTLTIYGSGFQSGASVKLAAPGVPEIAASVVTVTDNGFGLNVTLPLTGQANGVYDVVVANPGSASRTLARVFTVQPASLALNPTSGGDNGAVTVSLSGNTGFQPGASIRFVAPGKPEVVGANVVVGAEGFGLTATFDLRGKANGAYDMVVANPDGSSVTLPGAFQVVPGTAPQVYADILGRSALRTGQMQAYTFVVGNRGNVDAAAVPLYIRYPNYFQGSLSNPLASLPQPPGVNPPVDYSQAPLTFANGDQTLLPLILPKVPAGQERTVTVLFLCPNLPRYAHAPFTLSATVGDPLLDAATGQLTGKANPLAGGLPADAPHRDLSELSVGINCLGSIYFTIVDCLSIFFPPLKTADCLPAALLATESILANALSENNGAGAQVVSYGQMALSGTSAILSCATAAGLAITPVAGQIISAIQCGSDLATTYQNCVKPIIEKRGETVTSDDPNDLVGSEGDGSAAHFLSGQTPLRYTVSFANKETASAPAQRVVVTTQLDPARMDLSTFRVGPIGFGGTLLTPPAGAAGYSATVDLRPANNLLVKVDASLDVNTGALTHTFESLDPATGQPPEDPLAGFLPPDIHPPAGDGFAIFSVQPKSGLPTGAVMGAQASIVFDVNAAIVTPVWTNTIDIDAPSSRITALPKKEKTSQIPLLLTHSDNGAGVSYHNIYASEDGGAFDLVVKNVVGSSLIYNGVTGHSYAFFSQAVDGAGNVEPLKSAADAETKIRGADLVGVWKGAVTATTAASGRVKLTGRFKVTNQSPQKATGKDSAVRFYLSSDATLDSNDVVIGKDLSFGTLAPKASVRLSFANVKLPKNVAGSGMFVIALINPESSVHETDSSNNTVVYGPLP
jgi:uncharacterized repeat protein (TIGR03803 family)